MRNISLAALRGNQFTDVKEAFADMMSFRRDDLSSASLDAESNYGLLVISTSLDELSLREKRRLMRIINKHEKIIAAELLL